MPEHRSVSQYQQYMPEAGGCPYAYYLHRIAREWERPAAWLPQGLALHEAAEASERSGRSMPVEKVIEVYRDSYVEHTNRLCDQTPNFDYWFASGRYGGEQDIKRRFGLGMDQVRRYVDYYAQEHPEEVIWTTPDGTPAVELPFDINLGGVRVKGFIDQVVRTAKRPPFPRDLKSGRLPGSDFQLAVYAVALLMQFGVAVTTGDFWMARAGAPTVPYRLAGWTVQRLTDAFGELDEAIRAERFDPAPDPAKCRFCAVNSSCSFAASN